MGRISITALTSSNLPLSGITIIIPKNAAFMSNAELSTQKKPKRLMRPLVEKKQPKEQVLLIPFQFLT
jgi:hypothetical protein